MLKFRLTSALVFLVVIVGACGSPPVRLGQVSPSPSSPTALLSPQSSPSPAPGLLFAVVESGSQAQPSTVAIVGLDGYARARATFQPRVGPIVPDAYTPLQGVAQVVGSGVYYIDGAGTVRVLRVGSQPQIVARFPLQPAQEDAWFAVSPDGSRIVVGILTFPALGPIIPGTSWNSLVGPTKFDLESASVGGQTTTLVHLESPQGGIDPAAIFPIGWTSAGAVAMLPYRLTSQNAWSGGPLYLIDDSGTKTRQLGGSDCYSASMTPRGLIPCISGQSVAVRDQGGSLLWTTHVDSFNALWLYLAPDGQAISDGTQVETHLGGMVAMPKGFLVEGWLDKDTVVGRLVIDDVNVGNLAWTSLSDPTKVHDLGFKGDFVSALG
jgi:hypothetical protein